MSIEVVQLLCYPVKSCAGIALDRAAVSAAGLPWDRHWMIVSNDGVFLTQRQVPRMALIGTALDDTHLTLTAPGMKPLRIGLFDGCDLPQTLVTVWQAQVPAHDLAGAASVWLSQALGTPCSLFRVAQPLTRQPNAAWVEAWSQRQDDGTAPEDNGFGFADGFPLLVANSASLDALNARLKEKGVAPVDMRRFRPNIVIDGLDAFEEDNVDALRFGDLRLGLVKSCTRCAVPDVDPDTGVRLTEPGITLATFRKFEAGILFGENAIVAEGEGAELRVGSAGEAEYTFR